MLSKKDKKIKKLKKIITKRWKLIVVVLILLSSISITAIFLTLRPDSSIASIPGLSSSGPLQPFGGWITSTINCDGYQSCLPPNPAFALCAIVRCIFQVPFVLHVFNNYYKPPVDAFDILRETVAEPNELTQCPSLCTSFYGPTIVGTTPCPLWCAGVLLPLQKANKSPAGLAIEALRKAAEVAGAKSPGIVLILSPVQGKNPCNNKGYILGRGFGTGLYVTTPGLQVGDSCRGSYYSIKR